MRGSRGRTGGQDPPPLKFSEVGPLGVLTPLRFSELGSMCHQSQYEVRFLIFFSACFRSTNYNDISYTRELSIKICRVGQIDRLITLNFMS
jgi:hypothetical protein